MFVPFITKKQLGRRRGGGASSSSSSGGKSSSSSSSSSGGKSSSSSSSSSGGKSSSSSSSSSSTGKSGSSSSSGEGEGEGEGSSSSGSSSSKGSSGSSSSSGKTTKTSPINAGGSSRSASTSNFGGGKPVVISAGQLFSGRTEGGGTRPQVFGTRQYGSGYPGIFSRGVAGRGFPFYFWPLAWGTGIGYGSEAAYMHTNEYGDPTNSSRPGGAMGSYAFQSNEPTNSTNPNITTFRLVADNTTLTSLLPFITSNCSAYLTPASDSNTTLPSAFNASSQFPEQVVQYWRASSVALTLDGYNNSAVFAPENSTSDAPLPSGTDMNLLACLNDTIGEAVPLVDGAVGGRSMVPSMGMLWVWVFVGVVKSVGMI